MTKSNKNNKGFSTVEAVLIIVVLAVVGLGGWFVHHKHQESNDKPTVSTKSVVKMTKKTKAVVANSTSSAPLKAQSYFTVTQWGIRAPYTGVDRFTYTLSDDNKILTAISKQLSAADPGCGDFSGGFVTRQVGTDVAGADGQGDGTVQQGAAQHPDAYTKVGSYYYQFHHDQAECGSISIDLQNEANRAFEALVANFQAIPKS